ncbi:hypothetical protein VQL36_03920 [Chengkuizengella sp. SCS-71B]|uniref:hypothetical protein n=1 Tax=Chengkuizengella sp. SCS-71B TaxID=3115290 RepID=UPI0032C2408A
MEYVRLWDWSTYWVYYFNVTEGYEFNDEKAPEGPIEGPVYSSKLDALRDETIGMILMIHWKIDDSVVQSYRLAYKNDVDDNLYSYYLGIPSHYIEDLKILIDKSGF